MRVLREWRNRVRGSLRGGRPDGDLEQELQLHLELIADEERRRGRGSEQARREATLRAGGVSSALDAARDQRGWPGLDTLVADVRFGWRQITKHRATSLAAIASLGLAFGATLAAFRLVDATMLRPLPVANPDGLFAIATTTFVDSDSRWDSVESFDYPTYRQFARLIGDRADVMVIGQTSPADVSFRPSDDPETVSRQFVSGNVFESLGLRPAAGRLIGRDDDLQPGASPVAVVSYDYWTRRFARAPDAVGMTIRFGRRPYEIVGVAPRGFIGTEPGQMTDVFLPATMKGAALNSPGWSWLRLWVRPARGTTSGEIRDVLQVAYRADHQERAAHLPADTPRQHIDNYLHEEVRLLPAGNGMSDLQKDFRQPMLLLMALVALVLLIACANVANLLIAQAMTRTREMALRVSIGAGRGRLIRLMLVESGLLAIGASAIGVLFASWSAQEVISLLAPADDPVRLVLDTGWRALGFGAALTVFVTLVFGLAPALRASAARPVGVLRGREAPPAHGQLTRGLVAAQMAFCMFVLFVAALFVTTAGKLSYRQLGFDPDHLLVMDIDSRTGKPLDAVRWTAVADRLREAPGVDGAAASGWALMGGSAWTALVSTSSHAPDPRAPYFLSVGPSFFATLRIPPIDGRDFHAGDRAPTVDADSHPVAGIGIVNESFAREYFGTRRAIGQVASVRLNDVAVPMEIVGIVKDAAYRYLREPMRPTAYVPLTERGDGALMVRMSGDPEAAVATVRRVVAAADPDVRIRHMGTQRALIQRQMVPERLLATLSGFFAVIAVLLAGVGLYGVLNYAVLRRRREIGVRIALGARTGQIASRVAGEMFAMISVGSIAGLSAGLACGRLVQSLLFGVRATDAASVLTPALVLVAVAVVATIPPAVRAARVDPASVLRAE